MGYKKVCFHCEKAFNLSSDFMVKYSLVCPECGSQTTISNHLFMPPKKGDSKKWAVVEFLMKHGFIYQHIYDVYTISVKGNPVKYPENMKDAQAFVVKYKKQAFNVKWDDDAKEMVSSN